MARSRQQGNVELFKRTCRAVLKEVGVEAVQFQKSRLTSALRVVMDTESPGLKARVLPIFKRINELADHYGIVVSILPARALCLSKAGID